MWNTIMPSVKLLTEIPAMSKIADTFSPTRKHHLMVKYYLYYHIVLTFKRGIQHSLFDLGFLYHIGSCLGEDELSWSWFKTIPIIFNHRDTVLQQHRIQHSEGGLMWVCISSGCIMTFYYLNLLIAYHLENPHVYVLFTWRCYMMWKCWKEKGHYVNVSDTYWFWCPQKAERHSVDNYPSWPWR